MNPTTKNKDKYSVQINLLKYYDTLKKTKLKAIFLQ